MKKILKLMLAMTTFLTPMVGCDNANGNKGNVKLLSMEASLQDPAREKMQKVRKDNDNSNLDYQYIVLDKTETYFYVTINLSNPDDYHILDFNLTCDDKNLKIYVDDDFKPLTNLKSINWLGATNTSYTMQFQSETDNFLSTLKISKLLYIDREKASVKYNADVSTNNEVEIYKVDGVKINNISFNEGGISYFVEGDSKYVSQVKVNGNNIELNKEYYIFSENTKYDINTEYITLNFESILSIKNIELKKDFSVNIFLERFFRLDYNENMILIFLKNADLKVEVKAYDANNEEIELCMIEDFSLNDPLVGGTYVPKLESKKMSYVVINVGNYIYKLTKDGVNTYFEINCR